jgi:hypothetical protein|tara:strand:+ start:54 stop:566 length:513 start_codon:yes stop_codon:yes gene_type:complete
MSILDSINRSIRNIFVGSHKGEDIHLEVFEEKPIPTNTKIVYTPQPPPGFVAEEQVVGVGDNDLGFNPNEWFDSPNKYAPAERRAELEEELDLAPCEYEPPSDDDWFGGKKEEKEETMHEKMYKMATARYNPFGLGGSENCDSDISCNKLGGSEERIQEFTPENDPYGGY